MIVTNNVTDRVVFLVDCSPPNGDEFCNGNRVCCTTKLAVIISFTAWNSRLNTFSVAWVLERLYRNLTDEPDTVQFTEA